MRVADLESALQISGSLAPQTRVAVHARLPGTLSSVTVQIGDRVRAGQIVATLDRREIDAQVDAAAAAVNVARAGVESAEAALANAVLEFAPAKNLFEKGAIPKQRLDGAETAHRAASAGCDLARANLAQAEAALRRAREVQRDATLVSPLTGVVVERNYARRHSRWCRRRQTGCGRRGSARDEARSRRVGTRSRAAPRRHGRSRLPQSAA